MLQILGPRNLTDWKLHENLYFGMLLKYIINDLLHISVISIVSIFSLYTPSTRRHALLSGNIEDIKVCSRLLGSENKVVFIHRKYYRYSLEVYFVVHCMIF